jgi:selenoprotein W-related protein
LSNYQHIIDEFTFITGSKGAFEFKVDGDLVYSKKGNGRHAEPGELLELFQELIDPNVEPYPQK